MEKTYILNLYIADIIKYIHIFLIFFILSAPLSRSKKIISLNIFIILFILYGWITSVIYPEIDEVDGFYFGRCKLTELECKLRGIQYKNGFIYRLIKPFSSIKETSLDHYIIIFMCIWLIINISLIKYQNCYTPIILLHSDP